MNVSFLLPVYAHEGPFATAYLDISRRTEDAVRRVTLAWHGLRESLSELGTTEAVLDAMSAAVEARLHGLKPVGPQTQVIVGAADGVAYDDRVPGTAPRDRASWATLPDLFPVTSIAPARIPHIVALVDRAGADLTVYGPHRVATAAEVAGRTHPIRKVAPGGWSQRRFQQRAENIWASNAQLVADQVDRLARQHRTRLIVLAGDVRAKAALIDALPADSRGQVVEVSGGRAPGVDEDTLRYSTQRLVASEADARERAIVDRFAEQRGRAGGAVEGLPDTVAALRQGEVDHLLVAATGLDARIPIGPGPLDLATSPADLGPAGVVGETRADAALLRAAAAGSAEVHPMSSGNGRAGRTWTARDGVGGLLRF
jgi:Bacterial archaeo-eukaryotic release factor family 2